MDLRRGNRGFGASALAWSCLPRYPWSRGECSLGTTHSSGGEQTKHLPARQGPHHSSFHPVAQAGRRDPTRASRDSRPARAGHRISRSTATSHRRARLRVPLRPVERVSLCAGGLRSRCPPSALACPSDRVRQYLRWIELWHLSTPPRQVLHKMATDGNGWHLTAPRGAWPVSHLHDAIVSASTSFDQFRTRST